MAEYIEREAALRAIENKRNEYIDKAWKPVVGGRYIQDELFTNAALGCRAAEEEIKTVPASNVRPVVRGKWREVESGKSGHLCECSACKEWILFYYGFVANFCPNCGADMRGN